MSVYWQKLPYGYLSSKQVDYREWKLWYFDSKQHTITKIISGKYH